MKWVGRTIALALSLGVGIEGRSWAWGPVGHQTVAYIAEDRLSPATLAKVHQLLGPNVTLASVANWADEIRLQRPKTAGWHFIDIEVGQTVSESQVMSFCKAGESCVVEQITADVAVLKDPGKAKNEKVEALKFLVHFVGDLHQPLHTADDHDRGGNEKQVNFEGRQMKLHALWDHLIEKEATDDPRALATRLEHGLTKTKATAIKRGKPTAWALEGYKIAKTTIYPSLATTQGQLTADYYKQMRPIVEERLLKGGVRLAVLIENALR